MSITTEKSILAAIKSDALQILDRVEAYERLLDLGDPAEVARRIRVADMPGIDEGCMYLMATIPAKSKVDFLGGA